MISLLGLLAAITLDSTACAGSVATACPKTVSTAATATLTSPAVTTGQAVELVLIFIATKGGVVSVTASGGSFSTTIDVGGGASDIADAWVYRGVTSAALTGVTFSANLASAAGGLIMVLPFSSATTVLGTSGNADAASPPQVTLVGTHTGAKLYAVGVQPGTLGARTLTGNAASIADSQVGSVGNEARAWIVSANGPGDVTFGVTDLDTGMMGAVEVLDPASGPSNSGMMGFWGSLTAPDLTRGPLIARLWP